MHIARFSSVCHSVVICIHLVCPAANCTAAGEILFHTLARIEMCGLHNTEVPQQRILRYGLIFYDTETTCHLGLALRLQRTYDCNSCRSPRVCLPPVPRMKRSHDPTPPADMDSLTDPDPTPPDIDSPAATVAPPLPEHSVKPSLK